MEPSSTTTEISLSVILEAILLAANEPLSLRALREAVGGRYDTMAIQDALDKLTDHWQSRGLELISIASGYRFRTKPALQVYIERTQINRAPRYSKSVMETLAIIAYRQPVTRADIEQIRGVAVNTNAIKTLEARGWIESLGVNKEAPGQPTLWGTTKQFLNDLGLRKLADLPPLEDIASSLETIQMHQVALPLGDGVNGKDDLNPEKKPIPKKQQAKFAPLTQNRLPCHLFPPFPETSMPRIPRPNAPNRAKFSPVRSTPRAVKPADSASRTRPDHNNKTPERSTRRAGEVPNRPKGRMSRGESTVKRSSATPFAGARNDRPERSPRGSPRADGSFRSERPYRSERAERGSPSTASRQGTPRSAPSPRFSGFRVARDEGSRKSYARSDSRMPSSRDRSINPRLSGGSFRSENAPPERSWGRCEDVKALGRERPNRPDRSTHAKVGFRNHEARSPRTDQKSDRPSDRPSHDRYKPLNRPTVGEKSSHVARTPYPDKPRRPPRPFSPSSSRSTNNLSGTPFRAPQPRVVAPTPRIDDADGGERIHKALAQLGWGARREIEEWIRQGDVWVNGKSCELGTVLQAGDKIEIIRGQKQWREDTPAVGRRGRGGNTREVERFITWFPQSADHLPRVLLYHKPEGEIVSRNDPQFRPSVFVNLPKVRGGRWVNIGRLDVGSSGLILFTDDGELANQLMHPSSNLEREYAVRIDGTLSEEHMRQLMTGIEVEEAGMVQCVSVKPMSDKNEGRNQWYKFVLTEGKNREIRRMVESLGYQVSRLMRLRYGPVFMPRGLRRGKYEELEQSSVEKLLRLLGSKDAPKKSSRSVRSAPNKEALRHT